MSEAAKSRWATAESGFAAYTASVVCVALAAAVRFLPEPFSTGNAPFICFFLAILFSARRGGFGPGIVATALSVAAAAFDRMSLFDVALCGLGGIAVSITCGQLNGALIRSLRENGRLRLISDTVPQFLWTASPNGVCDFRNARWFEYTGAKPTAGPRVPWTPYVHPDDRGALEKLEADLPNGESDVYEFRIRRHDGVYQWFETRLAVSRGAGGEVLKWFGSTVNIEESHRERERFAQIVASAPGMIYKFEQRPDGSMPYTSRGLKDIFGVTPEEVADDATPIFRRIHPEDKHAVQASIAESARTLSLWRAEFRVVDPIRGERWVRGQSSPVLAPDGTVSWYGFNWDSTEQKRAEDALRRATERELNLLRTLVERAPMGTVMLDRDLRFIEASRRALDDAGMSREQVIGKTHYECFPDFPEALRKKLLRGVAGETLSGREERLPTPDGRDHWLNWQVTPWGDPRDAASGIIIYAEDITDRKRAEAATLNLELRYRALFENMSEGLAYCRIILEDRKPPDYIYLSVNASFIRESGVGNVAGMRMSEVYADMASIQAGHVEMFARVAASGVAEKCETFSERLGKWYSISAYSPERGYFVLIFEQITARKQAERAARQWQEAFEQSELAIAQTDAGALRLRAVNATFARMMGYGMEELADIAVLDMFTPEERSRVSEMRRAAEDGRHHQVYESWHLRKNGERFPVLIDSTLVRDEHGRAVSRVVFLQDLTERRRAEAELREREHTVRALLESAAEAILAVDTDGVILLANRMAAQMFGYGPDELQGKPLWALLPEGSRGAHELHLGEFFAKPGVRRMGEGSDLEGRRGDGTTFPAEISLSVIETQRGPMAIAFVVDVTERKRAEREILQWNADLERRVAERTRQLEEANGELESFSYSVSHDLRAPLRGIDGWSLALLEDYGDIVDVRGRRYLERVREETQRMGTLIDDLLALSRVTRREMRETQVDLSQLAETVAAELRELHRGRNIDFLIEPGLAARGDAGLLTIALTNLLENAVKFTAPRAVALIEFARCDRGFIVRDNGVGFDPRHADMLFGAFQRLHKASEFPGTGIGLATVKRVVRRHGGEVWTDSELDRGATFGFTLVSCPINRFI
jgi:PAS domain S-box-containing protein